MEAEMAVDLILKNENLLKLNCRIEVLIGDDDSSAIANLRRLSPHAIIKWSDFNHAHKTFNSKLYEIKIPAGLREYFSKIFSTSIKKNQGDSPKVKIALENIVSHAFGEHSNCPEDRKCKNTDGDYVYKYFKDGKCLNDGFLREKLEKIVKPFAEKSDQLAPCGSSQVNESWNNIVCSKHPKSVFYGGTESHRNRVAISVCQKNMGYEYVCELNSLSNLSPGFHTKKSRKRKQEIKEKEAHKRSSIAAKRQRLFNKKQRSRKNLSLNSKEGVGYQSGCGYLNTQHLIDDTVLFGKIMLFFCSNIILYPFIQLQFSDIPDDDNLDQCCIVTFDLETTGFRKTDEVVQVLIYRHIFE